MPVQDPTTRKLWHKLRRPDCTRCPLHEGVQSVCVLGDGPTPARLMAIGEAPGEREDDEERPFAGSAGRILDDAFERYGLSRSMFYITNAAKCRPPSNRKPKASELASCNVFLRAELRIHKPEYVLLLGDSALKAALGIKGLMANRQRVVERDGTKFFVALHPAAGLHRPGYKQLFLDDIAAFARLVRGESVQTSTKVKLIRSESDFKVFLRRLTREPVVAFDVETEGQPYRDNEGKKGTVTIFGAAFKKGEAWVVPLDHAEGWAPKRWLENLWEIARRLFGRGKKLIAHNGKYDLRWFMDKFPMAEYTFDTMLAAFLLNENRSMSLENLSLSELKVQPWKSDVEYRRDFPLKKYAIYNAKDCDYTFRLYELYKPQLQKHSKLGRIFKALMMPTANIFARIEHRGIFLPELRLDQRLKEAEAKEQAALKKLMDFVPKKMQPFNPGSSEQMARLLYSKDGLGLPFPIEAGAKAKNANKGLGSTAETPLKLLDHPISSVIEEWRYLKQKVIATYFVRWKRLRDSDGFVHFVYNLIGAVTGRISSDLHQVPRDSFVRGVLSIKDDDEWLFGAADFSQAEMRIAAHLSQDPVLLDIFRTGRIDVHTNTAMEILGLTDPKKVDSESRKKAKAVNFGFLYRMFEKKFRDYARDKFGVKLTMPEARAFRRLFFEAYRGLVAWHDKAIRSVKMRGVMEYLDGRLRRLPEIWSENESQRSEAERQAINSPVQGVVSDMALFSMVIGEYGGFGHKPLVDKDFLWMGQMHDEVIFLVRKKAFNRKASQLKHLMENLPLQQAFGFSLSVPIEAEVKRGQFWGESKVWEPEKEAVA